MNKEKKQENWECCCEKCISCCWNNPGWFGSIKEIKGAAKIMKMPIRDFAKEYLIQEWLTGEKKDVSIPAPRRNFNKGKFDAYKGRIWDREATLNGKGFKRASWGHNLIQGLACIFLNDDNRCLIHKSKPIECRESFGCKKGNFKGRESLLSYWEKHQDFIEFLT